MIQTDNHKKMKLIFPAAAILPVIFMLIAYARMGFYPFGDKTLYTWDLQEQYSSFMVLMHRIFMGKEQLNYSLTGGLGGNLYGLAAYYLGSPFNIIIVFFDEKAMPVGIMILILLKTACMGLFMFLYLYKIKQSTVAILFSTAYAFSAYAITYQSNIMWLDVLVFLPLVILGLEKLVEEGRCLLYIISLGLTIISNYFMAYMVCLFVVLYFIGMLLIEWSGSGIKKTLQTTGKFAASSLCGGGLSAFLLLPMLYEMQSGTNKVSVTAAAISNGAKLFYYRSILPMFLSCSYDNSQRWDAMGTFPLLYCGTIAVFGVILFFISRNILWKKKLFRLFLMAVLLISCNHMNLFFIWHGFYTPFGAPWRFMFLWGFVVLAVAYEGVTMFLEERSRKYDCIAIVVICLFFFWVFWRFELYRQIVLFNAAILFFEITGLFLRKYEKKYGKMISVLVCISAVGIELLCNALFTWKQGFEYESYSLYQNYIGKMEETVINEKDIYRSVITEDAKRNLNDGFLWGINTLESYTSTAKEKTRDIGEYMELGKFEVIGTYNAETTLLTKNIVSLKYIYGGETADVGYEEMKTIRNGISVFENKKVLPFGFLVNRTALNITLKDREADICEKQNALFHALAGSRGMEGEAAYEILSDKEGKEGVVNYIENTELIQEAVEKTAKYTLRVTAETESDIISLIRNDLGETAYVCYSVPCERGWKAEVDGKDTVITEGMGGLILVPVEAGEHEVRIKYTAPGSRAGVLISFICLIGVAVYVFCMYKENFSDNRI